MPATKSETTIARLLSNSEIGYSVAWALADSEDVGFDAQNWDSMIAVARCICREWAGGGSDAVSDILGQHQDQDETTVSKIWGVLLS